MILATDVAHRIVRRASVPRMPVAILAALLLCSLPPVAACLAALFVTVTLLSGFSALIVVQFACVASATSGGPWASRGCRGRCTLYGAVSARETGPEQQQEQRTRLGSGKVP